MRFFGKGDEKDDAKKAEEAAKKDDKAAASSTESQRLAKADAKKADGKRTLKTFTLGVVPHEKLRALGSDRFEEGLRAALPKGTKVTRLPGLDAIADAGLRQALGLGADVRLFEIEGTLDLPEALTILQDKGLLEGQIELGLDKLFVGLKASGRIAALSGAAEAVDRFAFRYDIRCESHEVFVQYPPAEVHRRWLADDDYRAAYGRWRTQRSEDQKPPKWHSGWPASVGDEGGPAWIRLRAKDGKPDEYALEFDEKTLLRFAFQGAEIKIMRFNLKVLSNRFTNEFSFYRSLPLTLESLPKDVQDRLNREPDRYKALKEPGKFGQAFDLVRRVYEELGQDYYQLEVAPASSRPAPPATPVPAPSPAPAPEPAPASEEAPSEHGKAENGRADTPSRPVPLPSAPSKREPAVIPAQPAGHKTQATLRGVKATDVGAPGSEVAPKP